MELTYLRPSFKLMIELIDLDTFALAFPSQHKYSLSCLREQSFSFDFIDPGNAGRLSRRSVEEID